MLYSKQKVLKILIFFIFFLYFLEVVHNLYENYFLIFDSYFLKTDYSINTVKLL